MTATVVQFSDLQAKKLAGVPKADVGKDDVGNYVINADMGPLEVSVYTSQDDGSLIVQIDNPTLAESEKPSLRVYLNDTTLYDPETESNTDSTSEGA